MRKALKIKTFTLLVAWLVIFAHSIIPHNHHDDNCLLADRICQDSTSPIDYQTNSVLVEHHPDDQKICHISSLLFQNFNPENLFPYFEGQIVSIPDFVTGKICIHSGNSFISPHRISSVAFRAPPSA